MKRITGFIQKMKATKWSLSLLIMVSMVISNPAYSFANPIGIIIIDPGGLPSGETLPPSLRNLEGGLHLNNIIAYMNTADGQNMPRSTLQFILNQIDKIDSKKPTVTISAPSSFVGIDIQAMSNEAGLLYLVNACTDANLSALDEASGYSSRGIKITALANMAEAISTTELDPGDYKLYAVDGLGNISDAQSVTLGDPLDVINAIVHGQSGEVLTLEMFTAAGVSGVNADNLVAIGQFLISISSENYFDKHQIQDVVDTYYSQISSFGVYRSFNSESDNEGLSANRTTYNPEQDADIRFTTISDLPAGSKITIALSDMIINATAGDWLMDGESGLGPKYTLSISNGTLTKAKDAIIVVTLVEGLAAGDHRLSGNSEYGVIASTSHNYEVGAEIDYVIASADITIENRTTKTIFFYMYPLSG